MSAILVDTNIIVDLATNNPVWAGPSSQTLSRCADTSVLVINPIIYAELAARYDRIEDLDAIVPLSDFRRDALPYEAGFLAGRCFLQYRRYGGTRTTPLPDFYIGAHAAVAGFRLMTRDVSRYRTYFPSVDLIVPVR